MHRYIYLTTVLCMNFLSLGCDEATTSTTQTGIFISVTITMCRYNLKLILIIFRLIKVR